MATSFVNSPSAQGYNLTCDYPTIAARVTANAVQASLIVDPNGKSMTIYSSLLYSVNGIVTIYDFDRLLEDYLVGQNLMFDTFELVIDTALVRFTALHCAFALDPDFSPEERFLTTSATSTVHAGSVISLPHIPDGSDSYHVKVVGLDNDGRTVMAERIYRRNNSNGYVLFDVKEIIDFALNKTDWETGVDIARVAYFSISHGTAQKIFYLADDPTFLTFRFRNLFNAIEYIDVAATVRRKTSVERETAVCGGNARQYNRHVARVYEVETGPLTADRLNDLEQLVCSHEVRLCTADYDYDVITTDHTLEYDNNDESLPAAKFTFRFVNERPRLMADEAASLMPSASRIFSEQFSSEFA